jgi:hypothetical protein
MEKCIESVTLNALSELNFSDLGFEVNKWTSVDADSCSANRQVFAVVASEVSKGPATIPNSVAGASPSCLTSYVLKMNPNAVLPYA